MASATPTADTPYSHLPPTHLLTPGKPALHAETEGLCPAGPRSFAGEEAPLREAKRGQACFSRACTLRRAELNSLGPIMDESREDREGHLKLQIWVLLLKRVPCVYASAQRSQAPEVPAHPGHTAQRPRPPPTIPGFKLLSMQQRGPSLLLEARGICISPAWTRVSSSASVDLQVAPRRDAEKQESTLNTCDENGVDRQHCRSQGSASLRKPGFPGARPPGASPLPTQAPHRVSPSRVALGP